MMGCIFAISAKFFWELGGKFIEFFSNFTLINCIRYKRQVTIQVGQFISCSGSNGTFWRFAGLEIWGGEQYEMSIKV